MKVVWTASALSERDRLISFIAEDNLTAALDIDDLLTSTADSLGQFPFRGRQGRESNSRELVVHRNYLLIYGVDTDAGIVYIKAVLHTAQQYPPEDIG